MIIEENTFLIISKCGQLVAKGTPRNRYICHIDEKNNKRFITYSSLGRANSGYQDSGFYLSDGTKEYIKNYYPQLIDDRIDEWIHWSHIKHLFEAKKFNVIYKSVELI